MKTYKVTIYPVTPWTVRVEAKNKKQAIKKAMELEGPSCYSFHGDNIDEWGHDIYEWPNIGNDGQIDVEKDE